MKTAIYIEDGRTQLVLTPDTEWEKTVLSVFRDQMDVKIYRGEFYKCAGGWERQGAKHESVILRLQ